MTETVPDAPLEHDPYQALRVRDFRLFLTGNVLSVLGMQMQSVAVGWEIYARTTSNLALAMVGLMQFLPFVVLALPAGQLADRLDRRLVVGGALGLSALASLGLAMVSHQVGPVRMMYGLLFVTGVARAFYQPAKNSLLPQIVPRERFSNAVTWNTGGFHLASVLGPALGGLLIAWLGGAMAAYLLNAGAALAFLGLLVLVRAQPARAVAQTATTLRDLAAGLGFLRRNHIILGAMTLDMGAVLVGGCTMLLPTFAEDILHVGAQGLGWLRTAPALGALAMSLLLAHRPPLERAGRALLWAVAGFGIATIFFGLSRSYWLSLILLFMTGAFDNISVVIRHTLVQLLTPDHLRGRVSAVNGLFIGASNELGGFESGLVAHLLTPTISVVGGGVGTVIVVGLVAAAWPGLRRYGRLGGAEPAEGLHEPTLSAEPNLLEPRADGSPVEPVV